MSRKPKSIFEDGGKENKENEEISKQGYQELLNRVNPASEVGQWAAEKVQLTLAHNPELTPLYIGAELPMPRLLEDKTGISETFLDVIGLQAEIQDYIREVQYHEPESVTQCNVFLRDIIERTALRDLIRGLIPEVLLSKEEEQDIESKIMVGKRPIDIRVYTGINRTIKNSPLTENIFESHTKWYLSGSTLTLEDKRNGTVHYYFDELIIWDKEMNIVGVFVVDKLGSFSKLCNRLIEEGHKYPEAWKYLTYLIQYPDKVLSNNH